MGKNSKVFTITTQLHTKNNKELCSYVDDYLSFYSRIQRVVFTYLNNGNEMTKGKFNTYLQNRFNISKRTANSIISDMSGRHKALKALKVTEKQNIKHKINRIKQDILDLDTQISSLKTKLVANETNNLIQYRNQKTKRFWKKRRLDSLQGKLLSLQRQLDTGKLKLTFGTKKLLNSRFEDPNWHVKFVSNRDKNLYFLGSKDEKARNQMFQLAYDKNNNQFTIQVRKDNNFVTDNEIYVFGKCYFKYQQDKIIQALEGKEIPLTYRILKNRDRYYLQAMFKIEVADEDYNTRSNFGNIGIDFNKGFITYAETNRYGDLIHTGKLPYRYGQGTKTESDLQKVVGKLMKISLERGKDLSIEDLDFKKTRNSVTKGNTKRSRKYNQNLHSLAYRKFSEYVENAGIRNKVGVVKVNPAWTSWIAENKYCNRMKLNIHTGASYVIARRGLGIIDKI